MAFEKEIKITVDSSEADAGLLALQNQINKTDTAVDNLNATNTDLTKTNKGVAGSFKESSVSVLENGGAMGILNTVTGGYAQIVKDAVESLGLFTAGSKIHTAVTEVQTFVTNGATVATRAFRASLVATGIGAIVVLITSLVIAMSNLTDETEEAERAQELFNIQLEKSNKLLESNISQVEFETKARKLRAQIIGVSEKELRAIETEGSEQRFKELKEEQTRLLALQNQKGLSVETSAKINEALLKNTAAFNKEIQSQQLTALENQLSDADKSRDIEKEKLEGVAKLNSEASAKAKAQREADAKEETERLAQLEKERLENDLNYAKEAFNIVDELKKSRETPAEAEIREYEEKENVLEDNNLDTELLTLVHEENLLKIQQDAADAQAKIDEEITANQKEEADKQIAIDKEVSDAKAAILDAQVSNVEDAFGLLADLSEDSNALQAVAIIGENAAGIAKQVINTRAANAAATLKYALLPGGEALAAAARTANNVSLGIGIASSAAATASALSALGESGSTSTSTSTTDDSSTSTTSSAPSFNLVQGTATNQIAESIQSGNSQPIKAYVVSTDMSTQQELDSNISANATFGK